MPAPLIDTTEAAQICGVSADLIRRYCRDGRIEAHDIGGHWLIEPEEIRRFAEIPRKRGWPPGKSRKPKKSRRN